MLNPWGEERADFRSAIVACAAMNAAGGKKGGGAFKPSEFMPKFGEPEPEEQSTAAMQANLKMFARIHNASKVQKP